MIALGILALLSMVASLFFFFRKGGIYNPIDEAPITPQDETTPDTATPPAKPLPEPPVAPQSASKRIYDFAYLSIGDHLTLNPSVPKEVGCVQAVSFVLLHAGFPIPKRGIDGVNALIAWLLKNGFKEVKAPELGAIVTSHRPKANDPAYAHAGICGKAWIMSNTSENGPGDLRKGLWQANYTFKNWNSNFSYHGAVTRYFLAVDNPTEPV